ncbi:unnamed protein product [Paramecium octaurelia]|uniref:Transmembrane protein n=1 Tax=Paramecium octaurelia TaxID=43137 RepID=A0A8S1X970_PAROT|nr:unnamed protein product [Paramecium octaurelia]
MNLIKITIFTLMVIILGLCCTLIAIIVDLDDDSSRFTNYFIMSCSGVFICLIIMEGYLYQFKPKSRHVQFPRMILLILAILVLLYSAITQISHALLDNNGNGKVPIIDPHDSDWYRLKQISRIIQYTTCTIVVILQILIGYKKKRSFKKGQAIESLIQNDNALITSLEPTTQKLTQNQVASSQGNSHMINTFESKNTQQIQAIQKLNNNNNNNS